jgi:hypothetical protein
MAKKDNEDQFEETDLPTEDEFDSRQIKDFERYQVLSDIVDSTFGTGSMVKNGAYSVKMKVIGDQLMEVQYRSVGNFTGNDSNVVKNKFQDEGIRVTQQALKMIKDQYVDQTDKKISFKIESKNDKVDLLQGSFQNPKRTCIYTLICMVKMN